MNLALPYGEGGPPQAVGEVLSLFACSCRYGVKPHPSPCGRPFPIGEGFNTMSLGAIE